MDQPRPKLARRNFLKAMSVGCGAVLACPALAISGDDSEIELSAEHQRAVNRRRRIVVQYDCHGQFGLDFDQWIGYRFSYADQPGTQIDALWWDLGRLGNVVYPSKLLNPFENHDGFKTWRDQGIDLVGRLVEETKRRNLECFWHHRVSEVDLSRDGKGAAWKDPPDPLKQAHPDWTLKCWWPHGLWDFSVPAVRQITVDSLREVAERYDFDGIQLDFARHVPCLPLGRQWELRHHVTDLVRSVRRMLLEVERKRGRPLLAGGQGSAEPERLPHRWLRRRGLGRRKPGRHLHARLAVDGRRPRRLSPDHGRPQHQAPAVLRRPPYDRRLPLSRRSRCCAAYLPTGGSKGPTACARSTGPTPRPRCNANSATITSPARTRINRPIRKSAAPRRCGSKTRSFPSNAAAAIPGPKAISIATTMLRSRPISPATASPRSSGSASATIFRACAARVKRVLLRAVLFGAERRRGRGSAAQRRIRFRYRSAMRIGKTRRSSHPGRSPPPAEPDNTR